jgi:acyl carrier protein phosphodiesterase
VNYLAHAYLSFNQPTILVGNIISDFIKGKKQFDYPDDIRQGILLHRAIDSFTDEHAATREAKMIFKPHYRLYSGPFTDIAYDYFLANDEQQFTENSLYSFSQDTYNILDRYEPVFPASFKQAYPYMKKHNWLFNYRYMTGIEKSFAGIARRALYITESETAFTLFKNNQKALQQCYDDFFPALKQFTRDTLLSLQHK